MESRYTWTVPPSGFYGLTTIAEVNAYLAAVPGGLSPSDPVPLLVALDSGLGTMTQILSGWQLLLAAIATGGKYVALDLSAQTMTGTVFDPVSTFAIGKDRIVTLILPDAALTIPDGNNNTRAFNHFSNIRAVSGASITTIGARAFTGARSLTSVHFPAATNIGVGAFNGASSLTNVSFPVATTIGHVAFAWASSLTSVSFPVATTIGDNAFVGASSLTSVHFPAVTTIDNDAFREASSLTNVSFPVATTIGSWAFSGASSLTSVSFPAATSIGNSAFSGASSLTRVSFPAATTIGNNAFAFCINLTNFILSGTGALSVIEGGRALVRNNTELVAFPSASGSVSMPGIITVGGGAFAGANSLTSVSFPVATTIGNGAFQNASSLTSVSLPAATTIGSSAFRFTGTHGFTITLGNNAPSLPNFLFSDNATGTITVIVPPGATGYTPFSGTGAPVTVSGNNNNATWANNFRRGGVATQGTIQQGITVIIRNP